MDVFECIHKRHCYRGSYVQTPVPREDLEKIIKSGLAAPSGCNKQTTSLVGLDDRHILDSITALIKKNGFGGQAVPAGICVLTQQIPGYADVYFNTQDYAAAIENMLIAITALGYASCWIEGQVTKDVETQRQIAQLLHIPSEYTVVGFLPIGIPEKELSSPAYKPVSERAWYNVYGNE
jgi:nitroreductase